jgi:hypothetical protein
MNNSDNLRVVGIENLKNMLKSTLKKAILVSKSKSSCLRKTKWTIDEDQKLRTLVIENGCKNWTKVSEYFNNKSPIQCVYRWKKTLKPLVDSEKLRKGLRKNSGKAINTNETLWTTNNELSLLEAVKTYGTCWSRITQIFKTSGLENSVKDKFYSILRQYVSNKLSFDEMKVNVPQMKVSELLYYLPSAILEYKLKLDDTVRCDTKCDINVCTSCKNGIREKIKNKILVSLLQKNITGTNIDNWCVVDSKTTIETFLKDKLINLYSNNN